MKTCIGSRTYSEYVQILRTEFHLKIQRSQEQEPLIQKMAVLSNNSNGSAVATCQKH